MATAEHSASDLGAATRFFSLDRSERETLAVAAADHTRRSRERELALHGAIADPELLQPKRERVVVIGSGFGGLSAAKGLAKAPVDVVVIDRHNYHLFQPLLYQVATAGLSPADIASPIRSVLSRQRNATVILANVEAVDAIRKVVHAEDRQIPYDHLIIATGAKHSYFSHDDWRNMRPG